MAAAEKWLSSLFAAAIVSFVLLVISVTSSPSFAASRMAVPAAAAGRIPIPAFAYYISGGNRDLNRILRLLLAVYHPRNVYLLELSADAPMSLRYRLAASVRSSIPAVNAFGNVHVVGSPAEATYMGSSVLAGTLHGASALLRLDRRWDWFITLSAADYPLVTQDDLLHAFSSAPRGLNFIDHTSDIGWKEYHRVQPIVVDPGLYLARRSQIFHANERRKTPESFKFFTEFCVLGWDNLPRRLLLYFSNVILPQEGYFHSVACNSPEFKNTTVNNDMRFTEWDSPPQMEPHFFNASDFSKIAAAWAPFARQFQVDEPLLDEIDKKLLGRRRGEAVPGGWCAGRRQWRSSGRCGIWGDIEKLAPGPRAERLAKKMEELVAGWRSQESSCQ
ncbi:core-2/I-branching beta-1,6-N-acetylglucosaminyltransferase family protein isoform X2 [Wolffia australiana]